MMHLTSVAFMGTKRRAVLNEAMDEKLARVEDARLADEVVRYCAAGHAGEDEDLIEAQVLELPSHPPSIPSSSCT